MSAHQSLQLFQKPRYFVAELMPKRLPTGQQAMFKIRFRHWNSVSISLESQAF